MPWARTRATYITTLMGGVAIVLVPYAYGLMMPRVFVFVHVRSCVCARVHMCMRARVWVIRACTYKRRMSARTYACVLMHVSSLWSSAIRTLLFLIFNVGAAAV